jgi:hypothetical protein
MSAYDSASEIAANGESTDVAIIDTSDVALDSLLPSRVGAQPGIRILALNERETALTESLLASSGVTHFGVCSPTVTATELVSRARQLLRD